ncbi:MAG TPA: hypothetical protein PKD52_06785 [Clostridiales bacterium]|nr:hypothetical protein [Clostridiales bacterium]
MEFTMITEYEHAFDEKDILQRLGMPSDHGFGENIRKLLEKTKAIAKPKAIYAVCPIEERTDHTVTAGGQVFRSATLAKKLRDVEVVYPYINTCGKELADYGKTLTDMVDQFAFDTIMEYYRRQIDVSLNGILADLVPEKKVVSASNPGSLVGWPINEQRAIFDFFGEYANAVGVTLNKNFLMFPVKSVAGLKFGTEGNYHDCELCQRSNCPSRKAAFNLKAYLEATEDH